MLSSFILLHVAPALAGTVFQHLEMAVPPALQGGLVHEVELRTKPSFEMELRVGDWDVEALSRDAEATAGAFPRRTTFGYSYVVADAGERLDITCVGNVLEHPAPWRPDNITLLCENAEATWSLMMTGARPEEMFGTLTADGAVLDVSATDAMRGEDASGSFGAGMRSGGATGYLFSAGRGPIGAVDLLNDGRVLVGDRAYDDAISIAATSLLLFELPSF